MLVIICVTRETCLHSDTHLDHPGKSPHVPTRRSAMTPDHDNRLHPHRCRTDHRRCPCRRVAMNSVASVMWSPNERLSEGSRRVSAVDGSVVCLGRVDVRGSSPESGRLLCFVAGFPAVHRHVLWTVVVGWSSVGRQMAFWAGKQEGECRLQDERRSGLGGQSLCDRTFGLIRYVQYKSCKNKLKPNNYLILKMYQWYRHLICINAIF